MAANIGPKIGIDGETEYRNKINQVIQQAKTLDSEMKLVASSFDETTTAEEKSAATGKVLAEQIKNQQERVQLLADMVAKSAEKLGENSTETLKWKEALNTAQTGLNDLEKKLRDNASTLDDEKGKTEDLGKSTKDLGKEMDDGADKASVFGDALKANLVSDAIVAGAKAIGNAVKELAGQLKGIATESAAFADEILTLSEKTGLSTDTLQEYQYMAELTDTSLDTITGSLTKLTKNMSSAQSGSKTAAAAFKKLGVAVTDENGALRSNQAVFDEVIAALGEMENPTERDAVAMDIFGKSAQDLNSFIARGADGIAAFRDEAHKMGYVLDGEALNSLGAVDDGLQRLDLFMTTIKNQIGLALAPALSNAGEKLMEFAQSVNWDKLGDKVAAFSDKALDFFNFVIDNGGTIASLILGIGVAYGTWEVASMVMGLVQSIKAFQTANEGASIAQAVLNTVMNANPIVLLVTLLAGLVAAVVVLWNTNDEFREGLIRTWDTIKTKVAEGIEKIGEKIEEGKNFFINLGAEISETFKNLKDSAISWGKDLLQNFIDGITAKWQALKEKVSSVASMIKSYLGFSEPEKGPLSNFHTFAPDMMDLFMRGITDKTPELRGVISRSFDLEPYMRNGQPAGTTVNRSYGNLTFNVYTQPGQDAEEVADTIERRLMDSWDSEEAVFA